MSQDYVGWPRAGVAHLGVLCNDPQCALCVKVKDFIAKSNEPKPEPPAEVKPVSVTFRCVE